MSTKSRVVITTCAVAVLGGVAAAQPLPVPIPLPPPPVAAPPDPVEPPAPPPDGVGVAPEPEDDPPPVPPPPPTATEAIAAATLPEPPAPWRRVDMPELLLAPAATMLPAGVIYSRSGVDTSGGLSSDLRFGLGDVAEFGVALTDLVRGREQSDQTPKRLAPLFTATFRMGLAEDRLFRHQPAVVLGFRKSFEYEGSGHRARVAELHLVASKHLGPRTSIHLNGSFWDASVETGTAGPVTLHDQGLGRQVRVGGGVAVRAVDDADILVDLAWVPEFCFGCSAVNQTRLRPVLSWGVRYDLTRWAQLQSGVRVPDIGDANLIDAQIFGQLTLLNRSFERIVARR
ncbi:MAG: hypothetical protein R3B06_23955 [Kofleriaceae bacterium]